MALSFPLGSTRTSARKARSEVIADDVARLVAWVFVVTHVLAVTEVRYNTDISSLSVGLLGHKNKLLYCVRKANTPLQPISHCIVNIVSAYVSQQDASTRSVCKRRYNECYNLSLVLPVPVSPTRHREKIIFIRQSINITIPTEKQKHT